MKSEFKFVGLERLSNENYMSATCVCNISKEDTFKALIKGTKESKEGLWKYMQNDKFKDMIALVEHKGFWDDGSTPKSPILLSIKHKN